MDLRINKEFAALPPHLKKQVADFIAFLKHKAIKQNKPQQRKFGSGKGFFKMADDFDAPLDDFKEYM